VLLDVDGTLVDSNDAQARAWRQALTESGYEVPWSRIRRLIGLGDERLLQEATGLPRASPNAHRIEARRAEIFRARELPLVRAMPGARELLERMRRERLRWTLAHPWRADELGRLLAQAGLSDLVEVPRGAGREPSRADPGTMHAALARLGLRGSQAVMIGDTPFDREAARLANMASILFRTGGWPDVNLEGAAAVYDGPWDLLAHFDESILKRQAGSD
jgi:phosphoglycolate phosphatase-like HAD superfamily hydrolase